MMRFRDRQDAGKELAERLKIYKKHPGVFVFGLPRGGAVVAYEVANALDTPLEVFLVRKLGVPWQPELAMGALAEGDIALLNQNIVTSLNIPESEIRKAIKEEEKELL